MLEGLSGGSVLLLEQSFTVDDNDESEDVGIWLVLCVGIDNTGIRNLFGGATSDPFTFPSVSF